MPGRVEIQVAAEGGLPPLLADRGQLAQAISLLVENGAESIPDRGRIRLEARELAETALSGRCAPGLPIPAGRSIRLTVEDDGAGIPPEILDHIFEPFFSTKFTGRGLGLSATLGILKSHGAGLSVESSPGSGTRFHLYFPLQEEGQTLPGLPSPHANPGARMVLFVDDEPLLRELAQEALEAAGYAVLLAADGEEALERFEAEHKRIGAVVMDVTMPRMNGLEAFERMQRFDPSVPVILSSGYLEPDYGARSSFRPAAFLNKPYPLKQLMALLEGVMDPVGTDQACV